MSPKRVAVVGAGPAGLFSLKYLSSEPGAFLPTAFEQSADIGGLWNFSEETGENKYGFEKANSIHKHLITNTPVHNIGFPGVPLASDLPSFVSHRVVKRYLDDFAEMFSLRQYIKLQTLVVNVEPSHCETNSTDCSWDVTTRDLITDELKTSTFDAVFVCSGVETYPKCPDIPGLQTFGGVHVHSKNYRDREMVRDKTVLVFGAAFSACDIIQDLMPLASKVYIPFRRNGLIHKDNLKGPNVEHVASVTRVLPDGVLLEDGQRRTVDVIISATGYRFHFPFLADECALRVHNGRVTPLYRHIVNIQHPSMFILSLPRRCMQMQMTAVEAGYAFAVLKGVAALPSQAEMRRQEEAEYQRYVVAEGKEDRHAHDLLGFQRIVSYIRQLEADAQTELVSKECLAVYECYGQIIRPQLPKVKKYTFKLVNGKCVAELNES